jgi:hypothetical protein
VYKVFISFLFIAKNLRRFACDRMRIARHALLGLCLFTFSIDQHAEEMEGIMRAITYSRLGTFALLGALMVQTAPALAWGYGHGMLQVNPDTGNVSGLDVSASANTQDGYDSGVRTNTQVAETEQAQTAAQPQLITHPAPQGYSATNANGLTNLSSTHSSSNSPSVAVISR